MKLLLIGFIILNLVPLGSAIDCYVCASVVNDDCGEEPDTDKLISSGLVDSGCGSCTKAFNYMGTIWSNVVRGCGPLEEAGCRNIIGHGSCSCTTSFCNGGRIQTAHQAMVVYSVVLLMVLLLL